MHVLVTGATGFVGGHLVPALVAAGHRVRVFVRDQSRYEPPAPVEVVEGDLLDPDSLRPALADVDVAYYLVHSMRDGPDYDDRDRCAARNFRVAADAAGVERVVYLGGLGGDRARLSPHLRSRRSVEHVLAGGNYALTTLRAAIIVGGDSASFRLISQLATRFPVLPAPAAVRTDCHPIAIDDVVAYLVGVLGAPETAGGTYEIGGPEVMTYADLLRRTGAALTGRRPRIVVVPWLSPNVAAYWVSLVTDVPATVARPLVEGLETRVVATDDRIREHVPLELTVYERAVEAARTGSPADRVAPTRAVENEANG